MQPSQRATFTFLARHAVGGHHNLETSIQDDTLSKLRFHVFNKKLYRLDFEISVETLSLLCFVSRVVRPAQDGSRRYAWHYLALILA